MIKAIAFDWGGVLIENPTLGLLQYCANQLQISEHSLKTAYKKYEEPFQKGIITEQSLWKNISPESKNHSPRASSLWESAFKNVYKEKKRGIPVCITTQTERVPHRIPLKYRITSNAVFQKTAV